MKTKKTSFLARAAMTLLVMMLTTATAWAWSGSGTSGDPYKITSTDDLNQLATNVNSGTTYQNVYFKLTKDITYSTSGLGETESNFTPIGGANGLFKGHFDGDGNTISGIRIYRSGSTDTDKYLGLFGVIEGTEGNLAEVKRVTLKNARITGYWYCGGIVGNCNYTQITDCHVSDDVTIHAVKNNSINHGGIAGNTFAYSEISGCTSDATISMADGLTGCDKFGGIAGSNDATIKECLVLPNAKVTCTSYVGAIVGRNNGTLTSNAYTRFGVFGVGALNSQWGSDQTGAQFGKLSIGDEPSDWSSSPSSSYPGGIKVYDKGIKYGGVGYKGMYDCNYTFTTMTDCWGITSGNDGSPEHPYIITTTVGLDLLADQVNKKTNGYYQKYFELGADITYSYTYAWNSTSNDNANQNNYTPIGTQFSGGSDYSFFTGYFDGKGHTVSGIRFFTDGNGWIDGYKGLFGRTDNEVKNVTLADTRITGFLYCGGIAGQSYSNITNCHVGSDVVIRSSSNYHGGIVGEAISNYPTTISGCTSAASSSDNKYGGIVGSIDAKTTVKDCLYLGAFLTGSSEVGAIASSNEGTLTNNYHTVFGAGGVNGADNDGAKFAVGITTLPADIGAEGMTYGESTYTGITAYANGLKYDNKYYITPAIFSLADDGDNSTALSTNDGKVAIVTLDDRTIYKDGNWNTLCLPFALDAGQIATSPLASFTIKEMLNTSNLDNTGKLTLNFTDATTIEAGTPYIAKWEGDLIIKNKADWEAFCTRVNNGETFEGKVVKLADDFDNSGDPVTTVMAGRYTSAGDTYYRFKGTLDGNGRTLTVNYDKSLTRTAPFQYVDGATIMNLTIAGSIKDSKKILGGLIGSTIGNTVISNCRVSATIQSTVNGDGTVGGFVALVDGGSICIENCLFDGRFEGSNTYRWSGFVGWFENNNATSLSISNCLFAPSSVNIEAHSDNRNFYRTRDAYTPTLDKAYYKTALATNTQGGTDTQGSDANDMDNTTLLSNLGSGWEISGGNVVPKMKMNTVADIVNPVFTGVTIDATAPTEVTSTDGKVKFVGQYSPFDIDNSNINSILYVASGNKIGYSKSARTLKSFRAHFWVQPNGTAPAASMINVDFGEGEVTGVNEVIGVKEVNDNSYYDLQGRKVTKPTKGLYIVNGKKVIIK